MRKQAVFVLGTFEPDAVKKGDDLTKRTEELLEGITNQCGIDADLVFVSLDPHDAGKNKASLGMKRIKKERPRVLSEIDGAKPDFVVCFGPVATACVFGKGNLVEGEMLRQAHYIPASHNPKRPVYCTFSIDAVRWKAGLAKWLAMDVEAAANGWTETEWGTYTVLRPAMPAWHEPPEWLRDLRQPVVALDLETFPGLDPWDPEARIRMAVVTDRVGQATVVQANDESQFPLWLIELMLDPGIVKCGANIKFDVRWLKRFGMPVTNVADLCTREHIIDESNPKKDLKSLTFRYVPKLGDYSKEHRDLVRERGGWEHVLDQEMYQYCGGDGEASIGVYLGQESILRARGLDRPTRLLKALYETLAAVEHRGMCISKETAQYLDVQYQRKLAGLRQEITAILGPINLNSPTQLANALQRAVPNIKLTKRDWARAVGNDDDEPAVTNRFVLEREAHKHPVIPLVLEFRKYRTRHSTFIKGVLEKYGTTHGKGFYIHPSYRTDVVETFRLSSQAPNGQNIPRKDNDDPVLTVKRQFISRFVGGSILEADQSQIEIRTAAWVSKDKKMLEAIESGEDIHYAMAAIMLGKRIPPKGEEDTCDPAKFVTVEDRQVCKARTFLILYGGGAAKLSKDLKISRRAAQRLIDDYFETFTGLRDYIQRTKDRVKVDLEVTTPFGFTRRFIRPDRWDSSEGFRVERQAFNTIVQSTAACITYIAMIELEQDMRAIGLKSMMVGQVHDSILVDVYPGEEDKVSYLVKQTMENAGAIAKRDYGVDFDVPLACDVELGYTWGDKQKVVLNSGGNA